MTEPRRLEPHQPLDAVGHHALSAGLEPIADDEPTQFSGLAKRMTAFAAGSHASPAHFRLEAVGHHAAALAQGVTRAPEIGSPNAVEHCVDAVTGKATNLLHEVRALVVDGNAAQFPDYGDPMRRAGSVHLDTGKPRQLQHCGAYATRGPVDQHTLCAPGLRRSMQHL